MGTICILLAAAVSGCSLPHTSAAVLLTSAPVQLTCPVVPAAPVPPPTPRTLGELTGYLLALQRHDQAATQTAAICREKLLREDVIAVGKSN